ncbi:hypothetical protein PC118_g25490 [Phytophthora cactorum]|uniref:Uncharacterized protein n=1 Tax=Phytophthora cactorum TaxID=29920 RepID=A0A8T1E4M3_9STRA|nr:hypothetical protein PC114_g28290 [Phytophthora cactorum]KAG2948280.1 hypothetical protein PC118_g25490 [Phytophthora cactorum]
MEAHTHASNTSSCSNGVELPVMSLALVSLLGAGPHRQPVCQGYGAATVVAFAHSAGKEQEIYHLSAVEFVV